MSAVVQKAEPEWARQWALLHTDSDQPAELFFEWIAPHTAETFSGKRVLDAGCGGGHHAALVSKVAREVVALDLNTTEACRARLEACPNVNVRHGDLATVTAAELGGAFDVVYSVGVLQHTHDPDRSFANLVTLVKPGGRLIVWVYSVEGNSVARWLVEPIRKAFLRFLPTNVLWALSWGITLPALVAIHTIYRLPLRLLPLYEYLTRSRTLTPRKVAGNVFDKLNAPHTDFIARRRIESWLARADVTDAYLAPHLGVSWRAAVTKK
jgi:SAM-dependent methyltransferase